MNSLCRKKQEIVASFKNRIEVRHFEYSHFASFVNQIFFNLGKKAGKLRHNPETKYKKKLSART
jgi:hypothetical protein